MNDKNALIISGVSWDSPWQRHHIISSRLLKSGYNVDFVENIISSSLSFNNIKRKIKQIVVSKDKSKINIENDNEGIRIIKVTNPPPSTITSFLDRKSIIKILSKTQIHYDLVILYIPRKLTLNLLHQISYSKLIYDCVRDFTLWPDISHQVTVCEPKIIDIASEIWCDSYWLENKLNSYINNFQVDKKVIKILPTLPLDIFEKINSINFRIKKIKNITYFGSLSNHVDIETLEWLHKKGFKIHFIGKSDIRIPDFIIDHGYITSQTKLFDRIVAISEAVIIPYLGNMNGVIPSKLMLALATGKPVFISSFYDSIRVAATTELNSQLFCYKKKEEILININKIEKSHNNIEEKFLNCIKFMNNHLENKFDEIF